MKPLLLWGGVDISPSIYGESREMYTQRPDNIRDRAETALFNTAVKNKIPIIGVCRGAQLICALNGGSLYQHTIPETQCHPIKTEDQEFFHVTAGHHQIMRPKGNYVVYGWNPEPVKIIKCPIDGKRTEFYEEETVEIVWFPDTKSLAIQPHPEWAVDGDPFVVWLNALIKKLEINYSF